MYLVFADEDITKNIELIEGDLPYDEQEESPDYDRADWKDIGTSILLGFFEEDTAKKAINKAAEMYDTDKYHLFAIKVDGNYVEITLDSKEE